MNVKKESSLPATSGAVLKKFLTIFIPVLLLLGGGVAVLYYVETMHESALLESKEVQSVDLLKETIVRDLESVVSDLMVLAGHHALEIAEGGSREAMAKEFLVFCKNKGGYDQIRLLDETGMEIIRVNRNGAPYIVPEDQLQSKAHRYYFEETFKLAPEEVYVSPFDLNVEKGEIEWPLKPMIRFGTPVYDSHGQKKGVLVLNYLASKLLQGMERLSANASGKIMLLNSDGFWLKGSRPEDEWGFMYEDKRDKTFGSRFPDVWQRISSAESGQFYNEEGLFSFATVYPLMNEEDLGFAARSYYWKIVSRVPPDILNAAPRELLIKLFTVYAFLLALIAFGFWLFARAAVHRKIAEKSLRSLEKAIETMQMGVTICDTKGKIVYTNPAEAEMHGYEAEELIGKDVNIFAPQEIRRPMTMEEIIRNGNLIRESVNIRKDGSTFPVKLISDVVIGAPGEPVGIVTACEDITERKRTDKELEESRERLRSLALHLQSAREGERVRIARNIHDELGQILSVFKLDLLWISKRLRSDQKPLTGKIEEVSKLVDNAIDSVQRISSDLRPTLLNDVGLVAGMEWQAGEFRERTGIECNVSVESEEISLDENISVDIFRIFQEALTNVVRHAEATRIDVSLQVKKGRLCLEIRDNGRGIEEKEISGPRSFGLMGMRERVYSWDGELRINGVAGKGTTLIVDLPINEKGGS